MRELSSKTAEQKLALFLFNLVHKFNQIQNYSHLISRLASSFAIGHFLDIEEINRSLETYSFDFTNR